MVSTLLQTSYTFFNQGAPGRHRPWRDPFCLVHFMPKPTAIGPVIAALIYTPMSAAALGMPCAS